MTPDPETVERVAVAIYARIMDWPDTVSLEQARGALTCADALGEHFGDCTKQPQTCLRCEREYALELARAALSALPGWRSDMENARRWIETLADEQRWGPVTPEKRAAALEFARAHLTPAPDGKERE